MSERARRLRRLIAEEIRERGPVSFERFMERTLCEPGLGYYAAGGEPRGPGVDFRTSPQAGEIFARLLASQVEECWRRLGAPEDLAVVEFGAGAQDLARGVVEALEAAGAWPARGLYLAVDLPRPATEARPAPEGAPETPARSWPRRAEEAQALRVLAERPAVVLSNEFADALPVRRFVVRSGRPLEVRVGLAPASFGDGAGGDPDPEPAFAEVEAEVEDPEARAALRGLPDLPDGFQFEVGLRARSWIEAVGGALGRGYVITLDYGYRRTERFRPERAGGTLLSYHRHRVERDPLARAGEQDLTSHVDFDDLIEAGRRAGLELVGLTDQMRFLTALAAPLGVIEGEPEGEGAWRDRLAFKELIRPGGMGTTFRVLVQAKGVPAAALRGLADPFCR